MCRRQFIGSRSSIERKLFTIIDSDEKYIYQQVAGGIFNIIEVKN